ncbi:MAG: hypothetical protein RPR40_10010 [Bermanella sp.]
MSNQTVAIAAIIAAILITFFAPAAYFDHKVNACVDAYKQQSIEYKNSFNVAVTTTLCVAHANGVR